MSTLFTKIINGEIPSYKVAENDHYFAFLDINPNSKGHTLVVPKKEDDKIFDLNEDEYLQLMRFSYKVAKAIERAVPCERVGMTVIGLEVPHVHVHLIPLHTMADANFSKKEELTRELFQEIAYEISRNFKE
ncbi:HIT family protein [Lutimonas zeaxanthinifaciens]|uniref:HIT family protein n=1 Tax=Lutimonas zeaxanthinifaciens TaxID=3060215 RepID=UPI00265D5E43|nr:HIT family protein [Lutimonas sp. YSD2104]WKK66318.1 HIT family protein [Lutimonas sp. YSD2104]